MTNIAIYMRLVIYPLSALGFFMLATCCKNTRMDAALLCSISLILVLQLVKAFSWLANPLAPIAWAEWALSTSMFVTCALVWIDFYRRRKS